MQAPPAPAAPVAASNSPEGLSHNPLQFRPSGSFAAEGSSGKSPRGSGRIRPVLQSIAQVNQERYELVERLENEMAEAFRISRKEIRTLMDEIRTGWPYEDK